jgi:hypothetical protein
MLLGDGDGGPTGTAVATVLAVRERASRTTSGSENVGLLLVSDTWIVSNVDVG